MAHDKQISSVLCVLAAVWQKPAIDRAWWMSPAFACIPSSFTHNTPLTSGLVTTADHAAAPITRQPSRPLRPDTHVTCPTSAPVRFSLVSPPSPRPRRLPPHSAIPATAVSRVFSFQALVWVGNARTGRLGPAAHTCPGGRRRPMSPLSSLGCDSDTTTGGPPRRGRPAALVAGGPTRTHVRLGRPGEWRSCDSEREGRRLQRERPSHKPNLLSKRVRPTGPPTTTTPCAADVKASSTGAGHRVVPGGGEGTRRYAIKPADGDPKRRACPHMIVVPRRPPDRRSG